VTPKSLFLTLAAGIVVLCLLYLAAPTIRPLIFEEDGIVETASALLFLLAFATGAVRIVRRGLTPHSLLLPAATILGLMGFLDEISFGARWFGWQMPAMPGGGEFDGIHDIFVLFYRVVVKGMSMLAAILGVLLAVVAIGAAIVWRDALYAAIMRTLGEAAFGYLALFVLFLGTAIVIDLELPFLPRFGPVEELCELAASIALVMAVRSMARAPTTSRTAAKTGRLDAPAATPSALPHGQS
jgi:hypothetical protein